MALTEPMEQQAQPVYLFNAQPGDQRCHHDRRHFATHDEAHQVQHFVMKDFAVLDGALKSLAGSDFVGVGHVRFFYRELCETTLLLILAAPNKEILGPAQLVRL